MLMHLAAAVETKRGKPKNRACVVVAGRCEPMQWEAYPHQYVHTNGALRCCDNGGCWKSHTIPLGDGDEKDNAENLCVDVVTKEIPRAAGNSGKRGVETYSLPRCMDMITAEEIVRCIELYYTGGALSYLTLQQARLVRSIINSPA